LKAVDLVPGIGFRNWAANLFLWLAFAKPESDFWRPCVLFRKKFQVRLKATQGQYFSFQLWYQSRKQSQNSTS
jgi:hypothetical protein